MRQLALAFLSKGEEERREWELTLHDTDAISGRMGTSFGRCLRLIINNQSLASYESACRPLVRYGYAHVEGTLEYKRACTHDARELNDIFLRSIYVPRLLDKIQK